MSYGVGLIVLHCFFLRDTFKLRLCFKATNKSCVYCIMFYFSNVMEYSENCDHKYFERSFNIDR